MHSLVSFVLLPIPLLSHPAPTDPVETVESTTSPAAEVAVPTVSGRLYQIQRRTPDGWVNVETAFRGTGEPFVTHLPAGDYRA
ncbi:MAG: hypothetical protein AAF907_14430, partial [Planctomycetota bacterium]